MIGCSAAEFPAGRNLAQSRWLYAERSRYHVEKARWGLSFTLHDPQAAAPHVGSRSRSG